MRKTSNWKNKQPLSKKFHQLKGTKFGLLACRLKFVKAYQIINLNEEALIKIFINEINSDTPKKNHKINKTITKSFVDISSMDLLDFLERGPKINRGHRYILEVIYKFSYFRWTILLKSKKSQSITNSFKKIFKFSKRKQNS